MDITKFTAIELAEKIKSKEFTAREVTEASLALIDAKDNEIGAFLSIDREGALAAAAEIDRKISAGEDAGVLGGVPVAVKDNICIEDMTTTCASKMLENYRPPYSAHVVDKLRAAGAVIIGKTNLDEFAMGSSTENSALKKTANPRNTAYVPGGSSGGSAAAVAAGFVPLALGSDTGGSIRQPASYCGVVGMKPTYGVVSRYGLVAFGSSLDQIGPFARNTKDAALLLDVIAGPDQRDSNCAPEKLTGLNELNDIDYSGLKIGLPKEYFETEGLDSQVRQKVEAAIEKFKTAGAEIREIHLPMIKYAVPTYYIVATAEASSNLSRFDGAHYGHRCGDATDIIDMFSRSREEGFGEEVKRRIMLGTYVLSAGYYDAYYLRALKVRTKIADDFANAFKEVDIIAAPVAPSTAFKTGEKTNDPLAMYLSDIYTISVNLAGLPGISLPCGEADNGMPVGLQLISAMNQDAKLLAVSAGFEELG